MTLHPLLNQAFDEGIFPITKRIAIGQFASESRCHRLAEHGVTDVLNVGDAQSLSSTVSTFERVADVPIEDLATIPTTVALLCVQTIHDVMSSPATKLYIHCSAGQNRSPTVLWLYLLACGMGDEEAKHLIVERAPDSIPGHGSLVNAGITEAVRSAGQAKRMTPTDPSVLQPAY